MRTITRIASVAALLGLVCLVAVGCGRGESYQVVPVSGTVTLDNKPLAGVLVTFQPVATAGTSEPGPGSSGLTDADGKFTLQLVTLDKRPGAAVGKHRVTFGATQEQAPDDDTVRPVKRVIPAKYEKTPQEFTVPPGGTDKADFPLTSR